LIRKSERLYVQNSAYVCPERSPAPELKLEQPLCIHLLTQYQFAAIKVKHSHYRPMGPRGSGKLRLPDSMTSAREGGRLSALRTGRLCPQQYPGTHFKRLSRPRAHGIVGKKIPTDTTGDRSQDLPPSSALTTMPPQAQLFFNA
jgi:hypothetical protein